MDFRNRIKEHKRIVLKIGTTSLVCADGINKNVIQNLSKIVKNLQNEQKELIVITSGAVGLGKSNLKSNAKIQTLASIGQAILIKNIVEIFEKENITIAQLLINKDALEENELKTDLKDTINEMLAYNVVPIINENDIILNKFENNDILASYVCNLLEGDILIILSDVEGMYDKDPNIYKEAKLISTVYKIDNDIEKKAKDTISSLGTGGMKTKVFAAKIVCENSADMVIASGKDINILYDILKGKDIGTLFVCNKYIK